jgi:hypothetical protein
MINFFKKKYKSYKIKKKINLYLNDIKSHPDFIDLEKDLKVLKWNISLSHHLGMTRDGSDEMRNENIQIDNKLDILKIVFKTKYYNILEKVILDKLYLDSFKEYPYYTSIFSDWVKYDLIINYILENDK